MAAGIACRCWALVDLVGLFGGHWVFLELLPALVVLVAGSKLVLFAGVGALAVVDRAVDGPPRRP